MRIKLILLISLLLISISSCAQRVIVRGYYPSRIYDYGYYHNYYPSSRVIYSRPYVERTTVYREPTRIVHIENVQRERVYVHNRVEKEYVYADESPIDEIYNEPTREIISEGSFTPNDMWEMPIHFKRNSAIINDNIESHANNGDLIIYSVVKFLRENPHVTISLYAYADIFTGTEEENYYLSKRRANIVYNALISKYEINPNRININVMGCDYQHYKNNKWNRCVIIKAD